AVEVVAVTAIDRLVWMGRGTGTAAGTWNAVGDARIGQVIAFHVVVVEVHPRRGAEAEGQGGGDTPAVVVDLVAAGDLAVVGHQVEAPGHGVAELVVAVEGVALGLVAAPGIGGIERVTQVRAFAHQVDGAASRATAADGRVRAL